jgi:hypothetical protein
MCWPSTVKLLAANAVPVMAKAKIAKIAKIFFI